MQLRSEHTRARARYARGPRSPSVQAGGTNTRAWRCTRAAAKRSQHLQRCNYIRKGWGAVRAGYTPRASRNGQRAPTCARPWQFAPHAASLPVSHATTTLACMLACVGFTLVIFVSVVGGGRGVWVFLFIMYAAKKGRLLTVKGRSRKVKITQLRG